MTSEILPFHRDAAIGSAPTLPTDVVLLPVAVIVPL